MGVRPMCSSWPSGHVPPFLERFLTMAIHRDLHQMYEAGFATYVTVTTTTQTLTCTKWGEVFEVTCNSGTGLATLARPTKPGLMCMVVYSVDDGDDFVLTVTGGYNADADTQITFTDAKDMVVLQSVQTGSTYQWQVTGREGTDAVLEELTVDTATITALTAPTANITALNYNSTTRTATADGTGTGTIADSGLLQFVAVTSASANNIIVLPTPTPGTIIILYVGANGYELRSDTPASVAINGGTGASAESAIAANQMVCAVCTSATTWHAWEITAATLTAVEAAA